MDSKFKVGDFINDHEYNWPLKIEKLLDNNKASCSLRKPKNHEYIVDLNNFRFATNEEIQDLIKDILTN